MAYHVKELNFKYITSNSLICKYFQHAVSYLSVLSNSLLVTLVWYCDFSVGICCVELIFYRNGALHESYSLGMGGVPVSAPSSRGQSSRVTITVPGVEDRVQVGILKRCTVF